jgi:type II restriction enzyme
MAVNLDKPYLWKADISQSVDMYNDWFMNFAPNAFQETRVEVTKDVEETLRATDHLTNITPDILRRHPEVLPTLRMSTCPPLAVDRLIGLASVPSSLVKRMEKEKKLPVRLQGDALDIELRKIGKIIERMADRDIFTWLKRSESPSRADIYRAATIVADRLCGSVTNPIIRNAQERRQLAAIQNWLEARQYTKLVGQDGIRFNEMPPGTFSFRMNVPVNLETGKVINIPVDTVIKPKSSSMDDLPIFLEAKSAGDFANVNKRRKEEAIKMSQLRSTYGNKVKFNLFLCGYFDSGYLGYEAAEGIDWVWEHRINDLAGFGL